MSQAASLPKLGITTPNAQGSIQPEAAEIFAGRVDVVTRGVNVQRLSLEGYNAALARLPTAIDELVNEGAEAIVVNGTSLSFAFGRPQHDEMVESISSRTGLPTTTMAASLVDALHALGAERVTVATAYDESVTRLLSDFLLSHGIESNIGACLGIVENAQLRSLTRSDVKELALRAAENSSMDALVISCGNLRTIPLTTELEEQLGVPVVSSALVGVWGALQLVGAGQPIQGIGRLFASDPQLAATGP